MKINRYLIASIASALAASAWAQSTPPALNLNLPPSRATAASPSPAPAKDTNKVAIAVVTTTAATTAALQNPPPAGAHYDANANAIVDAADSRALAACDNAAYGQPQVHGSIGMGVVAGLLGDKWNLGFLAETERQVEAHLDGHLQKLPEADAKSRAVVEQMKVDEAQHAQTAVDHGGAPLPLPVKQAMRFAADVMRQTASRV